LKKAFQEENQDMKSTPEIKPENVTAIVDTREQLPLCLDPLQVEVGTLCTGDYSVKGLEHVVRVERKSLPDLVQCVGRERDRFDREVQRLLAYQVRVLVVEATWGEIELGGRWMGKVSPNAVIGSLLGWQAAGLAVHLVGSHERAGQHTARLLYTVAKRRYRELRALAEAVEIEQER
jgi:DNA excision repair protein ERCC-4